jgi:hypothetical protein
MVLKGRSSSQRGFHLIASKSLAENLPIEDFLKITAINGVTVSLYNENSSRTPRFCCGGLKMCFGPHRFSISHNPSGRGGRVEVAYQALILPASTDESLFAYQIPTDVSKLISN